MNGDPHEHLDPEAVYTRPDDFGDLTLSGPWALHLHLLAGCPECQRRALSYLGLRSLGDLVATGGELAALLAKRRTREGEPLLSWLETLPAEEREAAVRQDPKFAREESIEALLTRARSLWARDAQSSLGWARLSIAAADELPKEGPESYLGDHLRGRAWAYAGNSLRILSNLREAEAAFRQAERWIQKGYADDLLVAELLSLKASLQLEQRLFMDADANLHEAAEIYRAWERPELEARVLLKNARSLFDRGDSAGALATIERARPKLDLASDPRLGFVVFSIELPALCELGRFSEAQELLADARSLAEGEGSEVDRLRVLWCEGRIAAALGPIADAETALRQAREGFVREGNGYHAALVSLDLACLLAEEGRHAEVRELASEMVPIFESRDVEAEALAALYLFARAAWSEGVNRELLTEVRRRVTAARGGG